jgi:hypothetical protein
MVAAIGAAAGLPQRCSSLLKNSIQLTGEHGAAVRPRVYVRAFEAHLTGLL